MIGYLTQNYPLIHAFAQTASVRRSRREATAVNRIFKMALKLTDCFEEEDVQAVKGTMDRPISGLVTDSRRVVPGSVFFALPGLRADGALFIDEAVSRGAVAVVAQTLPAHPTGKVTFIQVADARAALALAAQRYYRFPDRDMTVVGVTGTSGKTAVTHLLQHFINGDQPVGLLGSIYYDLGRRTVPALKTTPEAVDICGMLAQMREAGCRQAVMEVSSHGLDQQRVRGLRFGAAVFTNLSQDHLNYHKTLAGYFEVKSGFFTGENGELPKVAVVNYDDLHGEKIIARLTALIGGGASMRLVTYGENAGAQVRAEQVVLRANGTQFRLIWPGGELEVASPLIGRFHVNNVLGAVATAWGLGRDPAVFMSRLRTYGGVPGRMERIEAGQTFQVVVDSAHTEDALRNGLRTLRAITPGRLLVVFGCGGQRDRHQRALMAKAVQALADIGIATADNPRTEALAQIFEDMRDGVSEPEKMTWMTDRRRAIGLALAMAKPGDTVLIAGKGDESFQECADTVYPFDDREVARELLGAQGALRKT